MRRRAAFLFLSLVLRAAAEGPAAAKLPTGELSDAEAAVHALNRLGFGPRPGDAERVLAMGLEKHVERQLDPAGIDDIDLLRRLERFPTLSLSLAGVVERFPTSNVMAMGAPGTGARPMAPAMTRASKRGDDERTLMRELALAKLTRAVHGQRQLEEIVVDFWFNHFNVDGGKGATRRMISSYERDVIRPHAMGRFRDLLGAVARSPAMLYYLDNWKNFGPKSPRRWGTLSAAGPGMGPEARQLNENYARELLELHTVGVDGGYSQRDIQEVARCFTGWTMRSPEYDPEFRFEPELHDPAPKTVLETRIDAGGLRDGEAVLDLLARRPATARFISAKLARRFVCDDPPQVLVERMSAAFLETDGDIRAVLRAMISSPEFWSRKARRTKLKRPFELVASALRAAGAEQDLDVWLVDWVERLGERLYHCTPPTGYPDRAEPWLSAGALMNRLAFAAALAKNEIDGTNVDASALLGREAAPLRAIELIFGGQVSESTRASLESRAGEPGIVAALAFGSPEFQRR